MTTVHCALFKMAAVEIGHFTVVCLGTKPLCGNETEGDLFFDTNPFAFDMQIR